MCNETPIAALGLRAPDGLILLNSPMPRNDQNNPWFSDPADALRRFCRLDGGMRTRSPISFHNGKGSPRFQFVLPRKPPWPHPGFRWEAHDAGSGVGLWARGLLRNRQPRSANPTARQRVGISSPRKALAPRKLEVFGGADVRIRNGWANRSPLTAYTCSGPLREGGVKIYGHETRVRHRKSLRIADLTAAVGPVHLELLPAQLRDTAWIMKLAFTCQMEILCKTDFGRSRWDACVQSPWVASRHLTGRPPAGPGSRATTRLISWLGCRPPIRVTLFSVTGYSGKSSRWGGDPDRTAVQWYRIRKKTGGQRPT